ncbi:hypothetical protein L7F22_049109 [Adiantum nelumboides]|nr:hypothetical protein [Adiantum nelumboides]
MMYLRGASVLRQNRSSGQISLQRIHSKMALDRVLRAAAVMMVMLMAAVHEAESGVNYHQWSEAHATFYGNNDGSGTDDGACGYGNMRAQGYGTNTAALSTVLFNAGQSCGACFELLCHNDPQWCLPGHHRLVVTATNFCPPNWSKPSDNGGWCNPPRAHFDLAVPAFLQIAKYKAGIVPVIYRRVPCLKQGSVRFTLSGNPYFNMVLLSNVGGSGSVTALSVRPGSGKSGWLRMSRNWGQVWQCTKPLTEQSLSFLVTTDDGHTRAFFNVAPSSWSFGQTFEAHNSQL